MADLHFGYSGDSWNFHGAVGTLALVGAAEQGVTNGSATGEVANAAPPYQPMQSLFHHHQTSNLLKMVHFPLQTAVQ